MLHRAVATLILAVFASAAVAQERRDACAVIFDGSDFQFRTEAVFAELDNLEISALRWHLIDDEDAPDAQPEISAELVEAIRPVLVIVHFSAFERKQMANDNERFGEFVRRVERTDLRPAYLIYTRTPFAARGEQDLRAKALLEEVARHSRLPAESLASRIFFLQVKAFRSPTDPRGSRDAKEKDGLEIARAVEKLPENVLSDC